MERRGKISLSEILAEVDLKDVKAFLSYYAKNDKSFELAMKAHFISRIVTPDPDTKYLKILNQVIRPRTLSNDKIGPTLKKTIKIIFQDFIYQMDDLMSTENYKEGFYIIKNSLDKIAYLQNKYLIQDKGIEKFRVEFLRSLEVILSQNLAPAFRKKTEDLLQENIKKSYYFPKQQNLIILLDDYGALTVTDKKEVLNDLIAKANKNLDHPDLIKTMLQVAAPVSALGKMLVKELPHDKIFYSLSEMIATRKYKAAEFYLTNKNLGYSLHAEILQAMITCEKEEYNQLVEIISVIEPTETPIVILRELIQSLSVQFLHDEYKNLQEWIDKLPFSLRCELTYKANKLDLLIKMLSDKRDLEWLKVYDKDLIESGYHAEIEALYSDLAISFVDEHIGESANVYVLKIIRRLKAISQKEMLENIQNKLFQLYSHRKSLQNI